MVKMIISAPFGFDVEKFMSVVAALARNRYDGDGAIDYEEIDLARFTNYERGVNTFSVDAKLIDLNVVEIVSELQCLCPQVEMFFENSGGESSFEDGAYDDDYFREALDALYRP